MQNLGLYLHIPFCREKCAYCDFYSLAADAETQGHYAEALMRDLSRRAAEAEDLTVDTVYFGGGTPTVLGAERLSELLTHIRRAYRISPDAEITFEANPESARDSGSLRLLRDAGFNRVSLGVQSGDDGELRRIGRIHTRADVCTAVGAIRQAGFRNLSLDLMYALPEQTPERWADNLAFALSLAPEHLSCYALTLEEGTRLYRERASHRFPDDDEAADDYLFAVDTLARHGYRQYEISNFSREGFESRHNLRYWHLLPYLGFGPGAAGDFAGVRYAYARDLNAYCRGDCPYSEVTPISEAERKREAVMLGLRLTEGVDTAAFPAVAAALRPYAAHGFTREAEGRIALTPKGFLISNRLIAEALEAL